METTALRAHERKVFICRAQETKQSERRKQQEKIEGGYNKYRRTLYHEKIRGGKMTTSFNSNVCG
jgi:hypothetical protein